MRNFGTSRPHVQRVCEALATPRTPQTCSLPRQGGSTGPGMPSSSGAHRCPGNHVLLLCPTASSGRAPRRLLLCVVSSCTEALGWCLGLVEPGSRGQSLDVCLEEEGRCRGREIQWEEGCASWQLAAEPLLVKGRGFNQATRLLHKEGSVLWVRAGGRRIHVGLPRGWHGHHGLEQGKR